MHHRAVVVTLIVLLALAITLGACGGDPYVGTWTAPGQGTFVIAKANDGWWSVDNGPKGSPHVVYCAEINGELQTANGRCTFKRSGEVLEFKVLPDSSAIGLSRQ
jgi:hypothetical protein